jgi:hypothetical protein
MRFRHYFIPLEGPRGIPRGERTRYLPRLGKGAGGTGGWQIIVRLPTPLRSRIEAECARSAARHGNTQRAGRIRHIARMFYNHLVACV